MHLSLASVYKTPNMGPPLHLAVTDDQVRATLCQRGLDDAGPDGVTFGTITESVPSPPRPADETSLDQSIRDDLAVIRGSKWVRKRLKERSYGFVGDIKTGLLRRLDE